MSEGEPAKVVLKIFCVNCPAWLTSHERAQLILLHTSAEQAKKFANNPLPNDTYNVFDFSTSSWYTQYLPVRHP